MISLARLLMYPLKFLKLPLPGTDGMIHSRNRILLKITEANLKSSAGYEVSST